MPTKIVIIGGGFGGVYTAKHLLDKYKNNNNVEITLINKENYFLFTPMLHEVATGGLNRYHVAEPIRDILHAKNFHFLKAQATEVNFDKKIVLTNHICLHYDYLVIAVGATNNFFNIPGVEKHSQQLKTVDDAKNIKNKIIDSLEHAEMLAREQSKYDNKQSNNQFRNHEEIKKWLTFVVCGAGPTGVEVAAELIEFIESHLRQFNHVKKEDIAVYLIQRDAKILSQLDQKCIAAASYVLEKKGIKIKVNSACISMDKDSICFANGNNIKSYTKIWTAGVKPNTLKTIPAVVDQRGFFHVNNYLQLKETDGDKDNNNKDKKNFANQYAPIWAIRTIQNLIKRMQRQDFTKFSGYKNNKTPVPQTAQAATKEAKVVAANIINLIEKKELQEFHFSEAGFLVSLGQRYAIADIKGFHFKGFFAWWLWRTVYLFKIIGIKNKLRIAHEWTMRLFSKREHSRL
ncbi:NAD(P)/FAD-dependent oxidoreductase [Candidatus Woesearchaeota archaeon]|nr:NAD(P)/FAD-dependent oxidoreductase [Candidatus Woesearchaeota archaeon]